MLQRIQSFLHKKYRKGSPHRYSVLWVLSDRLIVIEFNKEGIPVRIEELREGFENKDILDLWFELSKQRHYGPLKTVVSGSDLWLVTCQPFKEPYELLEIDYNRLVSIGLKQDLWFYFMVEESWQHFKQAGAVITHIVEPLYNIAKKHHRVLVSYLDGADLWIALYNASKSLFFFNRFDASGKKEWIFWHVHIAQLLKTETRFLPIGVSQEWIKDLRQYGDVVNELSRLVTVKYKQYEPNLPVERYVLMLNFK
ncbi:MAG: hypothetical protein GXO48_06080 [Chlorobi bacterium]|nr:hypothetical protein [Chlorobiota bacterium]